MAGLGGGVHGGVAPSLTVRERDVLTAMADGLAAKAIARRLGVAVKTVENHKIRIYDKLGVRNPRPRRVAGHQPGPSALTSSQN